jgi:hypothetical protein
MKPKSKKIQLATVSVWIQKAAVTGFADNVFFASDLFCGRLELPIAPIASGFISLFGRA